MWNEKDALMLVKNYFRDDEKGLIMQKLPWFYAFSKSFFIMPVIFVLSFVLTNYFLGPLSPGVILIYLIIGSFFLHFCVTRSLYPNYVVVSQYSIYRYIKKSIDRAEEIKLSDIQSISVKSWRFFPQFASVQVRSTDTYIQQLPFAKRNMTIRTAQKNPVGLSFRDLSLTKPISFHFVIQNQNEWIQVLQDLQKNSENIYQLSVKRRT